MADSVAPWRSTLPRAPTPVLWTTTRVLWTATQVLWALYLARLLGMSKKRRKATERVVRQLCKAVSDHDLVGDSVRSFCEAFQKADFTSKESRWTSIGLLLRRIEIIGLLIYTIQHPHRVTPAPSASILI